MLRSLQSRLILASLLWTAGLLMLMHMLSMAVIHHVPAARTNNWRMGALVAVGMLIAGLFAARRSLTPFRQLRDRLVALRTGDAHRVDGDYPTEVQPLVDDLNALLEQRERAVKRAFATAGDLAHGLKTPLALLAQEAESASASGNGELAANIDSHVDRMSRQVNYHLARARAAASGPTGTNRCPVNTSIDALIRTLSKLYANRTLCVASNAPEEFGARVQREDLDEMMGNLLDNAYKWARKEIIVGVSVAGSMLEITIDDDGPGLSPELRTAVLERGVRADEAAPGSGLGLAIVRDLAELYGGSISLQESAQGGLRAQLTLPAG